MTDTSNDDEIGIYLNNTSDGTSYLESLIKSRRLLMDAPDLLRKLEEVIYLELDLAIMGSNKAKKECLKANKLEEVKDNLRPIK